jgi:hypothetical protein
MPTSNEFFDVECHGSLGVLLIKPYQGAALSQISYSHAVLDAIKAFETESRTVLLIRIPNGNFAPERMDSLWAATEIGDDNQHHQGAQFCRPTSLPLPVLRWESGVVQLLKLLQSVNLFKIIAVDGNVDFNLLGFLLAFDVRFCSRATVFENRMLDRALPPGFGVMWYLTRLMGQQATIDLVLNQRSIDAEQALNLKLVNHLSEDASLTEDALRYAKGIAEKPRAMLSGLAKAAHFPTWDFETYLDQLDSGFPRIPSR